MAVVGSEFVRFRLSYILRVSDEGAVHPHCPGGECKGAQEGMSSGGLRIRKIPVKLYPQGVG